MASKKENLPKFTSPRAVFKFPKLTSPDTKFNADGEYGVKLLLDPEKPDVQKFLKAVDECTEASVKQMKEENPKYAKQIKLAPAYRNEVDNEGNETGRIEMNVKRTANVTAKKGPNAGKTYHFKPALYDNMGKPLSPDAKIGTGSQGKVSFEARPYFAANDKRAGISLRLLAAQIIVLKEWGGDQDASSFGFGEEDDEGSFPATETAEPTNTTDIGDAADF